MKLKMCCLFHQVSCLLSDYQGTGYVSTEISIRGLDFIADEFEDALEHGNNISDTITIGD